MKTLFLTIILILFASLVIPTLQNAIAIPYMSAQDLYKQSDMVFHGQVISKQTGPGPDYYYYQVKVDTYFKNPQTSDSITVAGHKSDKNTHMSYPQFEIGNKAIFYINKLDGINTISPYSQIAGESCDVSSFVEPYMLPSTPTLGGAAQTTIYIEDVNENMPYIPLTNHTVILRYDNVWNNSPESRTVPVTLTIQNQDTGQQVFNQTQNLEIQACSGPETVKWNFVPTQIANYVASVSGNKNEISTIFQAIYDSTKSPILSPLKQFKSGIAAKDVKCNSGLQLVLKSEDNSPACVTQQTAQTLVKYGWGTPVPAVTEQNIPIISNSVKVNNTDFTIRYNITGGNVMMANADISANALIITVKTTGDGMLTVDLPRGLIDAQKNGHDDKFNIQADGQVINFKEINTTNTDRILAIPFHANIQQIEFIGGPIP